MLDPIFLSKVLQRYIVWFGFAYVISEFLDCRTKKLTQKSIKRSCTSRRFNYCLCT
jgi:hypothetical protein